MTSRIHVQNFKALAACQLLYFMFPVSAYDYLHPGDIVYEDIPNNVSYNVSYNHNESDYGKCRRHLFFQLSSAHVNVDWLTTIMKCTFHAYFVDMSELEDVIF